MKHRSCLNKIWNTIGDAVCDWIEWQEAKAWAKKEHPAWVDIATKSKSEDVRKCCKNMILDAYRGAEYV